MAGFVKRFGTEAAVRGCCRGMALAERVRVPAAAAATAHGIVGKRRLYECHNATARPR